MKKIVLVEGWFDELTQEDRDWFARLRREYGRIHVALWPGGRTPVEVRRAAIAQIPYVWDVHIGRAEDILPWLQQEESDALIRQASRRTPVFDAVEPVQQDLFMKGESDD